MHFVLQKGCSNAKVYGDNGGSSFRCSICYTGLGTKGPYSGTFSDCDFIEGGWIPICARSCTCS